MVCEILNLTVAHVPAPFLVVDHCNSIVEALQGARVLLCGPSELAAGNLAIDERVNRYLVSIFPHFFCVYRRFVPCGRHFNRIGIVSRIFNYEFRIIFVISFCIAGVFIWCLAENSSHNYGRESVTCKKISSGVSSLWAVTMGSSAPEMPRNAAVSILFT
jgi:hypothetical protein